MSTPYDTDDELLAHHWKICALNDAFRSELSLLGPAIADNTLVITHRVAAQGNAFVDRALKASANSRISPKATTPTASTTSAHSISTALRCSGRSICMRSQMSRAKMENQSSRVC
jgi:hypothetical protein